MAGFNLQEFKSVIHSNHGIAKNNLFLVEIPTPKGLPSISRDACGLGGDSLLSFYCKSSSIPGIGILTSDIFRYGYGPIERKPYGTVTNDSLMMFYVDNNNIISNFFAQWVRLIVNPNSSKGMMGVSPINGAAAYEMSYKQEYAVDIRVKIFDPQGVCIGSRVLVEAYPNYVADVTVDWQDNNSLMVLPIMLTYKDWYEEMNSGVPTYGNGIISDVFDKIKDIKSAIGIATDVISKIQRIF